MGIVINLDEKRKKKDEESRTTGIKQVMKDSLDNEAVKRRYGIKSKTPEPTIEERAENIRQSIARINSLMAELKETNTGKGKK